MNDYRAFYAGRRVIVSGGLGFIGSNPARHLVDLGADMLLVDSLIPDYGGNLFNLDGLEACPRHNPVCGELLSLPLHPGLTDADVARVAGAPRAFGG